IEQGIVRLPMRTTDQNITAYKTVGGAHFFERSQVPFAMSALETPVYHDYLDDLKPDEPDAVIVDVGAGDGRNSYPWLERGFRRIVMIDAVADALMRFRSRIEAEHPEWLQRLLLIECDARELPLMDCCAQSVLAIEALLYLNDDYERGLRECVRVLGARGRLLLSERDCEGGLLLSLLYGGVSALVDCARSRIIV